MAVMSSMVGIAALLREADAHELELQRGEFGEPGEGRPGEAVAAPGEGRPGEAAQRGRRGEARKGRRAGDRTCAPPSGLRCRRGSTASGARVGMEAATGESRLLALLAGRRATLDSTGFRGSDLGKIRGKFTRAEPVRGIRPQFPGFDSKV
jgi:hypothetical protein